MISLFLLYLCIGLLVFCKQKIYFQRFEHQKFSLIRKLFSKKRKNEKKSEKYFIENYWIIVLGFQKKVEKEQF